LRLPMVSFLLVDDASLYPAATPRPGDSARELAPRGDRRLAPPAAARRTVLADRAQLGDPGQSARPVARVRLGRGARRVELGDLRVESFEDDAGLLERPHEAPAAPQDVAHEEEGPDERADHEGRPHERPEHGPTLLRVSRRAAGARGSRAARCTA